MSDFLNTRLSEIHSGEILALIEELEQVCAVGSRHLVSFPLNLFLNQCVYPSGIGAKRVPISTASVAHAPILESRVGKLPDGDLRDLFAELALRNDTALEFYSGNQVVVFLNNTLPKFAAPKMPTEKQRRREAVAMQRRANRG